MAIPVLEFQVRGHKINKDYCVFKNGMMTWFKKMANFDFEYLILKHFSKKYFLILVDFFTKSTIFIIGTFHIGK
jgi:hypothetical protein